jgi:hypothetical protein
MTDRPSRAAAAPARPTPPRTAPLNASARGTRGSERTRKTHPLSGAFPLAVMTLATFLVLFAVMMARLKAGVDPVLRAGTSSSLAGSGAGAVRTRTSGAGASAGLATPVAGSEEASSRSGSVVTRASGALGTREAGDE